MPLNVADLADEEPPEEMNEDECNEFVDLPNNGKLLLDNVQNYGIHGDLRSQRGKVRFREGQDKKFVQSQDVYLESGFYNPVQLEVMIKDENLKSDRLIYDHWKEYQLLSQRVNQELQALNQIKQAKQSASFNPKQDVAQKIENQLKN